ncbi:hypothetical protein TL16_g11420 [Triparma laevis f. inornata]|uniref:WD40 repeat-like protein n=1 Tax=Triparma laevis f. inornata TaxID=1714386 RepID=A0A9W7BK14_9STRA|nr:hypothetical protein TL16_g11420 [Triparma laevis f. inornata]
MLSNRTSSVEFSRGSSYTASLDAKNLLTTTSSSNDHLTTLTLAKTTHNLKPSTSSISSSVISGTQLGQILCWKLETQNKFGGKLPKSRPSLSLTKKSSTPHTGAVTSLLYILPNGGGYLFTGSSDRTIKIWDLWTFFERAGDVEPCLQTLAGHGATVTSLVDCGVGGGVISFCLDKSMKVWMPEGNRGLMLNPFYVCVKSLDCGGSWFTSGCLRAGEEWSLFAGDSEGSVSVWKNKDKGGSGLDVRIKKKWGKVHKLAINDLFLIPSQNFLVTLSFDSSCCILDSISGSVFMMIPNTNRTRFEQMVLADALGNVEAHNVYIERKVGENCVWGGASDGKQGKAGAKLNGKADASGGLGANTLSTSKNLDPVISKMVWMGTDSFIMLFPLLNQVQEWKVKRDLECTQFAGHNDEVVGVLVIKSGGGAFDDDDNGGGADRFKAEESAVFTCGLDNAVKCWDDYDVTLRYEIKEKEAELSSIGYETRENLIVTGHDDGAIKFWNPDSGHCHVENAHSNTVTCIVSGRAGKKDVLVSSSFDGTIVVYDASKKKEGANSYVTCVLEEYQGEGGVGEEKVDENAGGKQSEGKRMDSADFLKTLTEGGMDVGDEVLCLHFHEESGAILSGGNDGVLKAWNLGSESLQAKWESGHSGSITCLAGDGMYLFSGGEDGVIAVWNLGGELLDPRFCKGRVGHSIGMSTLERQGAIVAHPPPKGAGGWGINSIVFTPLTGYLISAGGDGKVQIWDYTGVGGLAGTGGDGRKLKTLSHHDEIPKCLAFRETMQGGGDDFIQVYIGTAESSVLKFDVARGLEKIVEDDEDGFGEEEKGGEGKEEEKVGKGGVLSEG